MPYKLDVELTEAQQNEMRRIEPEAWFTAFDFGNVSSPQHPNARKFEPNNALKRELVAPWIRQHVQGKRVLDLFCANGTFSIEAALAGASEVVGMDFSPERIECARFLADTLSGKVDCSFDFMSGDVYELPSLITESFDVVMCFGGLYHVADPPFILTKIRELTREKLIMQTSSILPGSGNRAKFVVREDRTSSGMSSIRGGKGAWRMTVPCLENMLTHAGFRVLESKRPEPEQQKRFPWYTALTEPL